MAWLLAVVTHPVALVSAGGALGCSARYALGRWFAARGWSGAFPWDVLLINVVGSLLLGVAAVACLERLPAHGRAWFLVCGTGFCGGFTTFSTFELDIFRLVERGRVDLAAGYTAASVVGGFAALAGAVWLTRRVFA